MSPINAKNDAKDDAGRTAAERLSALLFATPPAGQNPIRARALARAVSLVEDGAQEAPELLRFCQAALQGGDRAIRIGITGPAGAGKSTLMDGLARKLREQGRRVAIVAVDPSSAFSGGAILGDRIRLGEIAGDPGVYLRSMAARGHLGGLARATEDVLTVIEAGFVEDPSRDVLLVETTGVGQGEIEVAGLADVIAVVLAPGMGDAVQSMKAGVLEIASVFVLNKSDEPGIERLVGEIGEMLALSAAVSPGTGLKPVVKTVATTGEGVGGLLEMLDSVVTHEPSRKTSIWPRPVADADSVANAQPVLDHLGIAVQSIHASVGLYEALGVEVSAIEEVAHERVRVAMLRLGESQIELLEATGEDSAVARFLMKRGEGLHHVALRVPDLTAAVDRLKTAGARLVSEAIQVGAGGHRYVFVHPASANGVLLELVDAAADRGELQ